MRNKFNSRFLRVLQLFCVAMLLPLSGCQKDGLEPTDETAVAKGQIELSFKGSADKDTRSSLGGSHVDYRTVKDVWVLVFKGIGHSATLIYKEDVGWTGDISQTYRLKSKLDEGTYTLLAIGVDDKAGATYQLPDGIAVGTTLRTTQASLAAGAGADDMAHSDFYVAQEQITVRATTGNLVSMTLRRRESGVQVYLKNIPYTVNYYNYDYKVDRIRVKLYDNQRTSILLFDPDKVDINDEANWPGDDLDFTIWNEMYFKYIAGYGSLPESSTLMEFNMKDYQKSANGNYYEVPAGTSPATLENTIYCSAFVLPIKQPAAWATNTLVIELWTDDMATGVIIDEPIKTYVVKKKLNSSSSTNCYALEGNHLYSVGQKLSAETTEGDKPADLSGNIIEVYAADYDLDSLVEVDFPPISTPAYIIPGFNPEKYIFNCVSVKETFTIDASYPSKPWTLTSPVDWIHFEEKDAEGNVIKLTQELRGEGAAEVTMVINDFVEQRTGYTYEQVRDDIRSAELSLKTSGNGEATTISIRQYNAITVQTKVISGDTSYYSPSNYAFNRLDYGCYFDRQTGEPVRAEPSISRLQWGYFSTTIRDYIYGNTFDVDRIMKDGEYAHQCAYDRNLSGTYTGSLFEKTRREGIEWSADGTTNLAAGKYWFTPAYHELQAINNYVADRLVSFNFLKSMYWTSSAEKNRSRSYVVSMGNTIGYLDPQDRNDYRESRQARAFK